MSTLSFDFLSNLNSTSITNSQKIDFSALKVRKVINTGRNERKSNLERMSKDASFSKDEMLFKHGQRPPLQNIVGKK